MSSQQFREKQEQPTLTEACAQCSLPMRPALGSESTHNDSASFAGDEQGRLTDNQEGSCQCDNAAPVAVEELGKMLAVQHTAKQVETNKTNVDFPKLGKGYEVLEYLGEGASGKIYKVRDTQLNLILAAKVLRPEVAQDPVTKQRFLQEASLAMSLSHENLVGIYGSDVTADGLPFIVMDYLHGRSLGAILAKEKRLTQGRSLFIFSQVLAGLAHAHSSGLIHRDLKPENIFVCEKTPGVEVVKLIDFGIAKLSELSLRTNHHLTQTGEVFGTPTYMSPEQCLGFEVDARSDLYSLGCVMYEALKGTAPFVGKNAVQIISKHLGAEPPALESGNQHLDEFVLTLLAKEVSDRPRSASQALLTLSAIKPQKGSSSLSVNARAMRQMLRSKRVNILPALRLPYGALNFVKFLSIILFITAMYVTDPVIRSSIIGFFGLLAIFAIATRTAIDNVSKLVESTTPVPTTIVAKAAQKGALANLLLENEAQPAMFYGESPRINNLITPAVCSKWVDQTGETQAIDIGNVTLARVTFRNFREGLSWWLVPVFLVFLIGSITGDAVIGNVIMALMVAYGWVRAIKRGDVSMVAVLTYMLPMAFWGILFSIYTYGVSINQPLLYAIKNYSQIGFGREQYTFALAWGYINAIWVVWPVFFVVRFLENQGVLRIGRRHESKGRVVDEIGYNKNSSE